MVPRWVSEDDEEDEDDAMVDSNVTFQMTVEKMQRKLKEIIKKFRWPWGLSSLFLWAY